MKSLVKQLLLSAVITLSSPLGYAGMISDYSLDSETNIVTDSGNNLEWLQWSVTRGQSLDSALAEYISQGWQLASGEQMAGLFNTFDLSYGDFVWQDGESNQHDSLQDGATESVDDRELIFVSLFGKTLIRNGWQYSGALFDFGNNDNTYHWAAVYDDWGFGSSDPYNPGQNSLRFNDSDITDVQSQLGIAFVRSTESTAVPEPSAFVLFGLALAGMIICRRKANKVC